jgi:hypothetical protein
MRTKRRRKERSKRKGRKRKVEKRKNMENFPNMKIFGENNKRQFMKLEKIYFCTRKE